MIKDKEKKNGLIYNYTRLLPVWVGVVWFFISLVGFVLAIYTLDSILFFSSIISMALSPLLCTKSLISIERDYESEEKFKQMIKQRDNI